MTRSIGAAVLAAILMFGGPVAINSAAAESSDAAMQKPQASKSTDLGARRRIRHSTHYADRRYVQPHYYDRPDDYRPYPYVVPVPFFLGFGFGPWW
jgi:Ni/Co efflux regulator RcnB